MELEEAFGAYIHDKAMVEYLSSIGIFFCRTKLGAYVCSDHDGNVIVKDKNRNDLSVEGGQMRIYAAEGQLVVDRVTGHIDAVIPL